MQPDRLPPGQTSSVTLAKGPVTLALKLNEVSGYAAALAQRARPRRRREAMLVELQKTMVKGQRTKGYNDFFFLST